MITPLLEATGIEKRYGSTRALAGVDLSIGRGEIVALVGENGAGKSTLGKILSGAVQPDAGTISVEDIEVSFKSTAEALEHGVAIVLQEFNLIPEMSVAENLFLVRPEGYAGHWWRKGKDQHQRAEEAFNAAGINLGASVDTLVEELSIAQQQIVEIVKSLAFEAKLFILDEPTAALGRRETEALLELIKKLRSDGHSVVIVTHRLDEVYAVADRIFVLRDGIARGEFDPETTAHDELITAMVGRVLDKEMHDARTIQDPGDVILAVDQLSVKGKLENCSLEVRRGEIVALAGLVGSGRTELVRAIFGADRVTSGTVTISGRVGTNRSPLNAVRRGLALVPEDRKMQGVHTQLPIHDNIALAAIARFERFWLRGKRLRSEIDRQVEDLQIKIGGTWQDAGVLSGGNQQKVALAKWLLTKPDLLLLDEPTRGIDVGARAELYRIIDALVAQGTAVLMVSSELPEVIALSDRVLVMSKGSIVGELSRDEASEEAILARTEIVSATS